MLRELHPLRSEITLVPHSGLQFVDFGFDIDSIARSSSSFIERTTEHRDDARIRSLFALSGDHERDAPILQTAEPDDEEYSINKTKALEPFLGKWVPVPLLRIRLSRGPRGEEQYDDGPSSWARLYVTELERRDEARGDTHRVVLAIDTELEEDETAQPYLTPTAKDAADQREFRLVSDPADMDWFLRRPYSDEEGSTVDLQEWVDDWLTKLFREFKQAQKPNRALRDEDMPYDCEHWARYVALLKVLADAIAFPKFRLLNTVTEEKEHEPIQVDLVLDVGNSRTCGILIESNLGSDTVDLRNSYVLGMRDLGEPERFYREPFESRVEFAQSSFGEDHIARRSGRPRSFLWPSLVRVGPEAVRLTQSAEGTEVLSGLSSPKRYLWDSEPSQQDWRFHGGGLGQNQAMIVGSTNRFVNEAGDVIEQVREEETKKLRERGKTSKAPAILPRFSRSSLYGFMLSELFMHALALINDPANRAVRQQSDLPRRLRNIILTLPSATPVQEQSIMRSRAEGAIKLLWQVMGWTKPGGGRPRMPNVIVDWDEASSTQLVYVYEEIAQKFSGQMEEFLRLKGRPRPRAAGKPSEPSLRLACIDIGGGTSDLMVTTFYCDSNRALRPVQNFREGFRIAGDDVVAEVVSTGVLPRLVESLEAAGVGSALEMVRELVSGNVGDEIEQMRQRRRQFALQVLRPLALGMIEASERMELGHTRRVVLGDLVGWREPVAGGAEDGAPVRQLDLPAEIVDFIEGPARQRGGHDWRLADLALDANALVIDAAVRDVLQEPLSDMLEAIAALDCDVVLLSGRPTQLPAVADMVRESLVVPPDRLIPMHAFKVGLWYPYRNPVTSRIGDPKTTAAVGGVLCLLSERRMPNFKLYTSELFMRSTARFVGEMELGGLIRDNRILFEEGDAQPTSGGDETAVVSLETPIHIGFRQMPLERWPATPLYRLDFANENARSKMKTPFKVTLRRREFDNNPEGDEAKLREEALKEAFVIEEIEDGEGDMVSSRDVRLRLHTLGIGQSEYWLDTGVFRVS